MPIELLDKTHLANTIDERDSSQTFVLTGTQCVTLQKTEKSLNGKSTFIRKALKSIVFFRDFVAR